MEKKTPHCKLTIVKTLVQAGNVRITQSALAGADMMGLNADDVLAVVVALTMKDFYKSMTTHADHRV